jgi:FkbM family methyltransferase
MGTIEKVKNKIIYLYKRYIQQDAFLLEVSRWFADKGDDTLRLDYPLTEDGIVFDVGGYHGDFAALINQKYGCRVYVFEPVSEFYKICLERFQNNPKIICLNYGLSSSNDFLKIGLAENASSFDSPHVQGMVEKVELRSVSECLKELEVTQIDLFKINIEGGEFSVLPALIQSGDIKKISYLQVQFHNFIDGATEKRKSIRKQFERTHDEMWNYEFVWESWKIKSKNE